MSSRGFRGSRLLDLFRSCGVPDIAHLSGEDLDWVWEAGSTPEVGALLDWMCDTVEPEEMVLTSDELKEWNELQPEDILHGNVLEEALKVKQQYKESKYWMDIKLMLLPVPSVALR